MYSGLLTLKWRMRQIRLLLYFGEYFTLDRLNLIALRWLDLLFLLKDLGEHLIVGVWLRKCKENNIFIVIKFHFKNQRVIEEFSLLFQ